jgi:hypothetical protein
MILFEHAVNNRRVSEARPPANSIWPWGGGTEEFRAAEPARIFANDLRTRELALGSGNDLSALPDGFDALEGSQPTLVWLDGALQSDALARLDRAWMAPAQGALDASRLSLEIVAGGRVQALRFRARPATLRARLRARFSSPHGSELLLASRGTNEA